MKYNINIDNIAYISYQLHNQLNRANSLNITKFNELKIKLLLNYNNILGYEIIKYIDDNKTIKEFKLLKIDDYFNLLPPGKIDGNKGNTKEGPYCLISTGQYNNGIIKYVEQYEYDGENNDYLTIAMYGTTGSCFYQKCKFIVNHNVRVLQPKENNKISLHIWAMMINYYLTQKYSYSNGLSIDKLLNELINIPIFDNNE